MKNMLRTYLRHVYRVFSGISGFMYDITRFIRYSGWRSNMRDLEQRNYTMAMVYHGLEKSLSYKERNESSGWKNAFEILRLLRIANKTKMFGYHDKASMHVLEQFISLPENLYKEDSAQIRKEIESYGIAKDNKMYGSMEYSSDDYSKGVLKSPEDFFYSRYSLRQFKDEVVSDEVIQRAVRLAMKTPSVCNRQAWGIYHTSDMETKNVVLSYQQGNKPFGEHIPNLMVVATDLKAFFAGSEHYQHWIDGGLLSMSLLYAFHSLGLATCPLNWSQTPENDKKLRASVNIKPNHTVIMLIAIGYPDTNNKVCASGRRPMNEVYINLEKLK